MKRLLALLLLTFLSLPLAAAPPSAEINLDIGTPPVILVKHTLAQRGSRLVYFLDPGVIGLGYDGMMKVRDDSRLNLPQLQVVGKLIDQENPDRNSLIYAIAEGHGGQQFEPAVRAAQIKRWKAQFHSGWWIEDEQGNWSQKP